MKRIILGDMHGRFGLVHDIYHKEQPDEVILVGDYFDSFGLSPEIQKLAFEDLIELRKYHMFLKKGRFIMLLGNHDLHYLPSFIGQYSGYNKRTAWFAADFIRNYMDKEWLSMIFVDEVNKTLYSHAGLTNTWFNKWCNGSLGNINTVTLKAFEFVGTDFFGNDVQNSPIWVRPEALSKDPYKDNEGITWNQIYGHTRVGNVNHYIVNNADLYNIDCLPQEYIVETLENDILVNRMIAIV